MLTISFVSATSVVLHTPEDSGAVSDMATLTASIDSNVSRYENCSWYVKGAGLTANTSWITIGDQVINATNGLWTTTYNTTNNLEDGTDYIFNVSCTNATNTVSDVSSSVVVDNTVPTTPSSLVPSSESTDDDGSISFSSTVTSGRTTACTLYFPNRNPGSPSYTMTHSGSSCTYTISSLPEETYDYYIRASDGTNNTDSAVTRFNVDIETPSNFLFQGGQSEALSIASGDSDTNWTWIIIGVVVLIAIIYLLKKK